MGHTYASAPALTISPASEELASARKALIARFLHGEVVHCFEQDHTEIVDHYLRRNLQESTTGGIFLKRGCPLHLLP
ncbi:MAG: hypothetical protein U5R49_05790 [Deltaproteobacteria bacterium]|nr:hypothetical protein [Deltaproteobacteria bacterium]